MKWFSLKGICCSQISQSWRTDRKWQSLIKISFTSSEMVLFRKDFSPIALWFLFQQFGLIKFSDGQRDNIIIKCLLIHLRQCFLKESREQLKSLINFLGQFRLLKKILFSQITWANPNQPLGQRLLESKLCKSFNECTKSVKASR